LAFIAHVKNNLYFDVSSDRLAIQRLKRDARIRGHYLDRIHHDDELRQCWESIITELERKPLHNSSHDPNTPEIDRWWNSAEDQPKREDARKAMEENYSGCYKALADYAEELTEDTSQIPENLA